MPAIHSAPSAPPTSDNSITSYAATQIPHPNDPALTRVADLLPQLSAPIDSNRFHPS
jgi:hypothetical protein